MLGDLVQARLSKCHKVYTSIVSEQNFNPMRETAYKYKLPVVFQMPNWPVTPLPPYITNFFFFSLFKFTEFTLFYIPNRS